MSSTLAAGTSVVEAPLLTEGLEALLAADGAGRHLTRRSLAAVLPGSRDDVAATLGVLLASGDVEERDGHLTLSADGRVRAVSLVRKHMLAERLLHDVIGLPWSSVHRQARHWERVMTDEVEQKLVELLEDPGTCPHGNPVPGSANRPSQVGAVPLAEAADGPIRVVRITEELEEDDDALRLLESAGLVPGAYGEVLARPSSGGVTVAGSVADAVVPWYVAQGTYVQGA